MSADHEPEETFRFPNAHKTRSGASYSPWGDINFIEVDFDIGPLAARAEEEGEAAFLVGEEEVLEVELQSARPRLPAPATLLLPHTSRTTTAEKLNEGGNKSGRSKQRYRARRRSKRLAKTDEVLGTSDAARRRVKQAAAKYRRSAQALPVRVDIAGTSHAAAGVSGRGRTGFPVNPVASTSFIGRRMEQGVDDRREYTVEDIAKLGFEYIAWDGRDPHLMLDSSGRVFAVLAGMPKDTEGWKSVNDEVQQAFEAARQPFEQQTTTHRRGMYPAVTVGISYGGGQKVVSHLISPKQCGDLAEDLLKNPSVQRLAGFGEAAFKLYAPRLYEHYQATMDTILADDHTLQPNFKKGVFGAATFNLGPRVATYVHTDHLNLPAGWCAITAVGDFDPRKGGHLVLWDLNLIIEFPPGALILIPSAILRHSNTAVLSQERRYSFTQYSAGGLFRWAECGCMSQKQFLREGGAYTISGAERWRRGVGMWNTREELRAMSGNEGSK